jgi:hypothetical protein
MKFVNKSGVRLSFHMKGNKSLMLLEAGQVVDLSKEQYKDLTRRYGTSFGKYLEEVKEAPKAAEPPKDETPPTEENQGGEESDSEEGSEEEGEGQPDAGDEPRSKKSRKKKSGKAE